jgi:HK97 family phage major capsid protein
MDFKEYLVSKKVEDISTLDAEKQAELYNDFNEASKVAIESAIELKASKEDVDAMKSELSDTMTKQFVALQTVLKEQGLYMKKIAKSDSIKQVPLNKLLFDNKDALAKLKGSSNSADNVKMTLKAVGDMSIGGNTTGQVPQADRNPIIGDIKSRTIKLMDLVTIGSIGSNLKEWMYVANEEGAAGATGEGLIKNQIDFEIIVGSQKVEKITAYITITDEMLDDVEQMQTLINNKLTTELNKSLEQGVFDGSGVSPILNGIDTVSPVFAAGVFALTVDNANEVDVLQVASNQIEIANQDMATAILMHPSDVTSLLLTKMSSTDKRYVERLQMIAGTLSFDGIPVVKTTLVTVGEFLMGDFSKAKVDFKQGVTIEVGYNADNFVKNYKTIRGEVRAVCYVENNDRTAFVKGVFATAKAALETV